MSKKHESFNQTYIVCLMLIFICSVLIIEILLNLCPPITRDALIHHLAIPKIWLNNNFWQPILTSDFSFYPMNIQLLYTICLWFNSDIFSKFIHMGFGLGTGFLIYKFIKQRLDKVWALLGVLMFISLPIVIWLSTSAYIDLGMTFFTTASILYFIQFQWDSPQKFKNLIFSAIFMGLAIGSKYNALIVFFFVNTAVVYLSEKNGQKFTVSMNNGLIFFVISILIVSPWYIKNVIYTGNPFYPLFNSVFQYFVNIPVHPLFCKEHVPELSMNAITLRKILFNESIWETLMIPIRMFFKGNDQQYRYFQGQLNPMLIIFIPFIFIPSFHKAWMKFLLVFIFFYGYIAFFTTRHQVR
ncbi:dolichyl-phosphate-mannose-protein mannosyltransferase, partial [Candidatus Magnetomorum sp. HK-1]